MKLEVDETANDQHRINQQQCHHVTGHVTDF